MGKLKISRSIMSLVLGTFLLLLIRPSSISAAADDWSDGTGGDIYNNNSGDVGIGLSTDPEANLHVYGEDGETALKLETETEGDNLLMFDGGRLQVFRKFGGGNLALVDAYNDHDIMRFYRNSDNVEVSNGDLDILDGNITIEAPSTVSLDTGLFVELNTTDPTDRIVQFEPDGTGGQGFTMLANGHVGIGNGSPDEQLVVDGAIKAEEVIVVSNVPDYVFSDNYELMSIDDLSQYIEENNHLPNVTPAYDLGNEEPVSLGARFTELLEKIEELTLYTIQQQKEIDQLRSLVSDY